MGPFLLTLELLPILLDTARTCGDVRILFLSSSGHAFGVFDPKNMNGEHDFRVLDFQCRSKLYNVRFNDAHVELLIHTLTRC